MEIQGKYRLTVPVKTFIDKFTPCKHSANWPSDSWPITLPRFWDSIAPQSVLFMPDSPTFHAILEGGIVVNLILASIEFLYGVPCYIHNLVHLSTNRGFKLDNVSSCVEYTTLSVKYNPWPLQAEKKLWNCLNLKIQLSCHTLCLNLVERPLYPMFFFHRCNTRI